MCDYSLMGVPNRLACEGEELVVYEFRTGSRGLTPADAPQNQAIRERKLAQRFRSLLKALFEEPKGEKVAVCIPPGARLLLRDIPEDVQKSFCVRATEEVSFTQLTAKAYEYRDAFRFTNGREILLQRLNKGQRVTVLQVSFGAEDPELLWQEAELLNFRTMRIDFVAPRLFR
ncbi:MAG TPA: hypothetical protein VFB28_00155 [Terriglobales bacterium]|jgi:hypothetical protein|nr:hypothetical protein [Terriglobales bacterium]